MNDKIKYCMDFADDHPKEVGIIRCSIEYSTFCKLKNVWLDAAMEIPKGFPCYKKIGHRKAFDLTNVLYWCCESGFLWR
ncbi:MAG: hypothetical protein HQL77_18940 [Magnetococcales bacterium]|nr:hypothetical protein [Magnetococcales bacterium]